MLKQALLFNLIVQNHTETNNSTRHRSRVSQRGLFDQDRKQSAQSSNLNILDLGFFHSLQRHAAEIKESGDLCTIVNSVNFAFKNYDTRMLELVWQALFNV